MEKNFVARVFKGAAIINCIIGFIIACYFGHEMESFVIFLGIFAGVFDISFLQYACGEVIDLLNVTARESSAIKNLLKPASNNRFEPTKPTELLQNTENTSNASSYNSHSANNTSIEKKAEHNYDFDCDISTSDYSCHLTKIQIQEKGDLWTISGQLELNTKNALKGLMIDLSLQNIFGDEFIVKDVQLLLQNTIDDDKKIKTTAWECELPQNIMYSLKNITPKIQKIIYDEELLQQRSEIEKKIQEKKTDINEMIDAINLRHTAALKHEYFLSKIKEMNIVLPEEAIEKLNEAVVIEKYYGNASDNYMSKLKSIFNEYFSEE